eukprot:gene49145-2833_t
MCSQPRAAVVNPPHHFSQAAGHKWWRRAEALLGLPPAAPLLEAATCAAQP